MVRLATAMPPAERPTQPRALTLDVPERARAKGESYVLATRLTVPFCLLALLAVAPLALQQDRIRSGARTVAVYATVTDAKGRLVADLPPDAFEIFDNGP